MANIYTSREDEKTIEEVLNKGLHQNKTPKWKVLRLALAYSLRLPSPPDVSLDQIEEKSPGYDLEQVTGQGQGKENVRLGQQRDYTDAIRGLLGCYTGLDLFTDEKAFIIHLQRHIRRGLREIRRGWREGHDFYQFLYQELCAGYEQEMKEDETDFSARLGMALAEIGVLGEIETTEEGPRITRYFIRLADPNHLDRVRRGMEKITFSLGMQKYGVFLAKTDRPKVIGLDVPRSRASWKSYSGQDLAKWMQGQNKGVTLPLWPGVDVTGTPFSFDLARQPHLLVGGTTGSGKSICLHTLILSLLTVVKPERLQLVLIDPKRVEFALYSKAASKRITVITEMKEVQEELAALVEEMESRITLMETQGVRDLTEGLRRQVINLPYKVVFVEELADLIMQVPVAEEYLIRLAQKARAAGIHLVLATQRPDAQTLNGLLRANIPSRIALTVQKSTESKIILDETGAERLTGAGDMLIRLTGQPPVRVHGVSIIPDDIAAIVRKEGGG